MRALVLQVAGAAGVVVGVALFAGLLLAPLAGVAAGLLSSGVALLAFGIAEERG